jgi:cytochrome c oxidase subunit 2
MHATAWLFVPALTRAHFPQTTTEPATAWMRAAAGLIERQSPWVVVAFAVVLGALAVTALRLRARRGGGEAPGTGSRSLATHSLVWLWSLAPLILVTLVALPVWLARLHAPVPPVDALRVNVIGHQWWWEFRYPDQRIVTATDLHLPVGRPVTLIVESADAMHSFWVPAVGPRQDVPPLRRREFSFTPDRMGVFPGQCAEMCGASHAHMHLKMFVEPGPVFEAWVRQQLAPRVEPDSIRGGDLWRGRVSFVRNSCRGCHTIRGLTEGPIGPDLTHFASRTSIAGGMFERTDANLARWILHANALKPGSMMPGFPVPERQLKPLVAYLQSLR